MSVVASSESHVTSDSFFSRKQGKPQKLKQIVSPRMWVKAIRSRSKKDLHAVDQPMTKKPKKNLFAKVFRVTKVLNAFKAKKRLQESDQQQLLSVPSSKDSEILSNMYQPSQLDYLSPNLKCNKFSKVNHWKKNESDWIRPSFLFCYLIYDVIEKGGPGKGRRSK